MRKARISRRMKVRKMKEEEAKEQGLRSRREWKR